MPRTSLSLLHLEELQRSLQLQAVSEASPPLHQQPVSAGPPLQPPSPAGASLRLSDEDLLKALKKLACASPLQSASLFDVSSPTPPPSRALHAAGDLLAAEEAAAASSGAAASSAFLCCKCQGFNGSSFATATRRCAFCGKQQPPPAPLRCGSGSLRKRDALPAVQQPPRLSAQLLASAGALGAKLQSANLCVGGSVSSAGGHCTSPGSAAASASSGGSSGALFPEVSTATPPQRWGTSSSSPQSPCGAAAASLQQQLEALVRAALERFSAEEGLLGQTRGSSAQSSGAWSGQASSTLPASPRSSSRCSQFASGDATSTSSGSGYAKPSLRELAALSLDLAGGSGAAGGLSSRRGDAAASQPAAAVAVSAAKTLGEALLSPDLPPSSQGLSFAAAPVEEEDLTGVAPEILNKAREVRDSLLRFFKKQSGHNKRGGGGAAAAAAAAAKATEVLRTALAILGGSSSKTDVRCSTGLGGPNFSAPAILAHPDEFRNPSSFLKIYGDPMCSVEARRGGGAEAAAAVVSGVSTSTTTGVLPTRGRNGNWLCGNCHNVNFPRRFRCNKCGAMRGPEGDAIVSEYAKQVYRHHLSAFKMIASSSGVEVPLKRLKGKRGGGGLSSSQQQQQQTGTAVPLNAAALEKGSGAAVSPPRATPPGSGCGSAVAVALGGGKGSGASVSSTSKTLGGCAPAASVAVCAQSPARSLSAISNTTNATTPTSTSTNSSLNVSGNGSGASPSSNAESTASAAAQSCPSTVSSPAVSAFGRKQNGGVCLLEVGFGNGDAVPPSASEGGRQTRTSLELAKENRQKQLEVLDADSEEEGCC